MKYGWLRKHVFDGERREEVFFSETGLLRKLKVDKLKVAIYRNRDLMGKAAAEAVANDFSEFRNSKNKVAINFAAAPSQYDFYGYFTKQQIAFEGIIVTHMDEFRVQSNHPISFVKLLRERLVNRFPVPPCKTHWIKGDAENAKLECERYARVLMSNPTDIQVMGIGENGHIAFNDPYRPGVDHPSLKRHRADFFDPKNVKVVRLDEICIAQQKKAYPREDIPKEAISITIPAIMRARVIACIVPGKEKAKAIQSTLSGPISTSCPASILRIHDNAWLFLDIHSADSINV